MVEFLQAYTFLLRYKGGVENNVVDALSHRIFLLVVMRVELAGSNESEKNMCLALTLEMTTFSKTTIFFAQPSCTYHKALSETC